MIRLLCRLFVRVLCLLRKSFLCWLDCTGGLSNPFEGRPEAGEGLVPPAACCALLSQGNWLSSILGVTLMGCFHGEPGHATRVSTFPQTSPGRARFACCCQAPLRRSPVGDWRWTCPKYSLLVRHLRCPVDDWRGTCSTWGLDPGIQMPFADWTNRSGSSPFPGEDLYLQ